MSEESEETKVSNAQLLGAIKATGSAMLERLTRVESRLDQQNGTIRANERGILVLQAGREGCLEARADMAADVKELQDRERALALEVAKWGIASGLATSGLLEVAKMLIAQFAKGGTP